MRPFFFSLFDESGDRDCFFSGCEVRSDFERFPFSGLGFRFFGVGLFLFLDSGVRIAALFFQDFSKSLPLTSIP